MELFLSSRPLSDKNFRLVDVDRVRVEQYRRDSKFSEAK